MAHIPVLKKQVLEYLNPESNDNFVDGTIGEGGYAFSILEKNIPKGKVLGIELDPVLFEKLENKGLDRLVLVNGSYSDIKKIVQEKDFHPISGVVLDLGVCSWHIEESGRGFTFKKEEPLDMRFDPKNNNLTAEEIINKWPEEGLFRILRDYGEERFAKRIAREIIKKRGEIKTTSQLVEIIKRAVPFKQDKIHFATRTFQALRIAVNKELDSLERALPQIADILSQGGKIVIISFHSLEDRIVKNFFKSSEDLEILTKKPIKADEKEIKNNPRARSAKLRAAVKNG